MITLAEILEIQTASKDANLCLVRVPLLEPAGNKTKVTMWATMILPPGIRGGYEVGDVVFISFVDNSLSRPVVLGQLYRGPLHADTGSRIDNIGKVSDTFDQASEFSCRKLKATESAQIPVATKLEYPKDVTVPYQTISALVNTVSNLETEVATLKQTTSALASAVSTLEDEVDTLKRSNAVGIKTMLEDTLRILMENPIDWRSELKDQFGYLSSK